jgi:hypothetical protein
MPVKVGDVISTSYDSGPYRVRDVSICNDPDCFVYHHVEVECTEHFHLTLLDADYKGTSWVNGILPDLTFVHCDGEYITILPESDFPLNPKQKSNPQMELGLFA